MPYFPDIDTIAADKVKLIKIVKELYKSKGIPDSFKFLFKALYNTNVDIYETSKFVLKASDGKWVVPKSIKIKSLDTNFLNIDNFKIFGETSKSIAVIEKSKVNGKFTQIYVSNIQRLFASGETIRILDYNDKDVYFLNGKYVQYTKTPPTGSVLLTSKIIGSLSNIDILPKRRGKYYKVGDPVVITGGFNGEISNPIGAVAQVSEVTTGQILNTVITNGGYGYTKFPTTTIDVIDAAGNVDANANCIVSFVDSTSEANVAYISNDLIEDNLFTVIGATTYNFSVPANANTQLKDCLNLIGFSTYPITAVTVRNGGGGYDAEPSLDFKSLFYSYANTVTAYPQNLVELGILAPIQIENQGLGYDANDKITIVGGDGNFAFARIKSITANGSITSVEYYQDTNNPYALGGMGYNNSNLPQVVVASTYGANVKLTIPSILATGAEYTLETDKIGAITRITLNENGEDYNYTPNVSLRIQDIVVTGTNIDAIDPLVCSVFQGALVTPTFFGNIESIKTLYFDPLTNYQIFSFRIYDYKGSINSSLNVAVYDNNTKDIISTLTLQNEYTNTVYKNGIKIYGDGSAVAKATFLNGLIEDEGRYLNSDGQLSAHIMLQDDTYNSSTYILSTEKDYESYKTTIQNLLHPIGTHLITRNLIKSNSNFVIATNTAIQTGLPLINVKTAILIQNSNSVFSNAISVNSSVNIYTIFSANDRIYITGDTNLNVYSTIARVYSNTVVLLQDYVQYKYPNVYNGYTVSNTIVLTNNNYTDTKYSMNTFVSIGDSITLQNNSTSNVIINIIGNTLYFSQNLEQIGTNTNTANVTLIKSLTSNNVTTYISV